MPGTVCIGVAGGTGSKKTTVALDLLISRIESVLVAVDSPSGSG